MVIIDGGVTLTCEKDRHPIETGREVERDSRDGLLSPFQADFSSGLGIS